MNTAFKLSSLRSIAATHTRFQVGISIIRAAFVIALTHDDDWPI